MSICAPLKRTLEDYFASIGKPTEVVTGSEDNITVYHLPALDLSVRCSWGRFEVEGPHGHSAYLRTIEAAYADYLTVCELKGVAV